MNCLSLCSPVLLSSIKLHLSLALRKIHHICLVSLIYVSAGNGIFRAANEKICIFTFKIKPTKNARELGDSYLTTAPKIIC